MVGGWCGGVGGLGVSGIGRVGEDGYRGSHSVDIQLYGCFIYF